MDLGEQSYYSIAIESPCVVYQPRVALSLASYLSEFDDTTNLDHWIPITDHRLQQLQAHPEFREMLSHPKTSDLRTPIEYLSSQGGVILELPNCHQDTSKNPNVFQVSMSCQEPAGSNYHLWLNDKRIPEKTLTPMIANAFFDWASNGGDQAHS